MCQVLKVSTSGYYQWLKRKGYSKEAEYKKIAETMLKLEEDNNWELGGEALREAFRRQGINIGLSKIYRIKRIYGIYPRSAEKKKHNRRRYKDNLISENILDRRFDVKEINKVWACDIKYIQTDEGFDYLAVVVDLASRRVVGFMQRDRMTAELVRRALERAIEIRRPGEGLVCHSDRGSQYTSLRYQSLLKDNGMTSSMSRPGTPYDNACVESFFSTLEKNFLQFKKFKTKEEARYEIWNYIERFYNRKRMHSYLGWMSPAEYEANLEKGVRLEIA
jgi:Transposase and inactivated derivatives